MITLYTSCSHCGKTSLKYQTLKFFLIRIRNVILDAKFEENYCESCYLKKKERLLRIFKNKWYIEFDFIESKQAIAYI